MSPRYCVEVKERGIWEAQGDGPMSKATAERIAREIKQDCRVPTRVVLWEQREAL